MKELPETWVYVQLGELTSPFRSRCNPSDFPSLPFIGLEQIEAHTRKLLGTVESATMKSTAFRFFHGDVLYGRLRPYLNKVYCAEFQGLCSSEFLVLPSHRAVAPKYLQYYLNTEGFVAFANQLNTGDRPRVSFEQIASHEVPLPPVNEQWRIAMKLDKVLSLVDAAQARLANIPRILESFRRSILNAACTGSLTADWRSENQAAEQYESTSVDDVAEYVGGFAYKSPTFTDNGMNQVIRIGNVRPFVLNLKAAPVFIPDNIAKTTERFQVLPDDIVISMTGTKYKRDYGYSALVPHTKSKLFLNQRVARLRCGNRVLPRFMLYWLQSDSFRNFFFRAETGNVNQGNVGADAIRRAPIELPSLPEQTEIVRRVEALFETANALEARYLKGKAHIDKLTQSILAKAFRGELVPQDPNDEPASVLLERILRDQDRRSSKKSRTNQRQPTRSSE